MKAKFSGFRKCMEAIRRSDPQAQEDGFHQLLPHAGEHVDELIEEFRNEENLGLRCWLLELIGAAKSPDAFEFLAGQLRSPDQQLRFWAIVGLHKLGTQEASTLLWQARSFTLGSPQETEAFRAELRRIVGG